MIQTQVSPCYPADLCTTVAPPAPTPQLARTGATGEPVSLALVALALIVVGLVLLVALRRKVSLA